MMIQQHAKTAALTATAFFGASLLSATAQTIVGPQVRTDTGRGNAACNETTMAVSFADPLRVVGGWNDYRVGGSVRSGFGFSSDGGESWNDFLLRPPGPNQAGVEGDPMVCADDRTGTLWAGAMAFSGNGGIYVARMDPGSNVFNPSVMAIANGGVDKGWMEAGADPSDPTNPDKVKLYVTYNQGCLTSDDEGDTWNNVVSLGGGLGFLPRVGPDGILYVTYWDFGTGIMLKRSLNGGASFGPAIRIATRMDVWGIDGTRFPGGFRVASLNAMAVDPNDSTLYVIYFDTTEVIGPNRNVDLYFCKSVDQGLNWTIPAIINGDNVPHGDQFFPWLEVDQTGRLHLMFYDTRSVPQTDNQFGALIEAYYSTSTDQGSTWTESVMTPAPFNSADDGFGDFFIGDYNGLATAGNRTLPLYLDTQNGNADTFTNVIREGPATSYCFGILCPCGNDDWTAGCANSTGSGASLKASGSDSFGADDLVLTIEGALPNKLGIVLMAATKQELPFQDGRLCLTGNIFRFFPKLADASGSYSEGPGIVNFTQTNFPPNGQIAAGETWNFQGWSRDLNGPCATGSNLSNALTVQFTN